MISRLRAFGVNIRPCGLDSDLAYQSLSLGVGVGPGLNLRAHEDFVSIPASHRHAAVLPAVNSDRPSCCCGHLLLNHAMRDRKSTRLNSSHLGISYAVFCLKKKKKT